MKKSKIYIGLLKSQMIKIKKKINKLTDSDKLKEKQIKKLTDENENLKLKVDLYSKTTKAIVHQLKIEFNDTRLEVTNQIDTLTNANRNIQDDINIMNAQMIEDKQDIDASIDEISVRIDNKTNEMKEDMNDISENIDREIVLLKEGINECLTEPSPCNSNENCVDMPTGHKCCPQGFIGQNCDEFDYCAINPCNYGKCLNRLDTYECNCIQGFTGQNCDEEINYCASNPCIHGQCLNQINGYKCKCETRWQGAYCDSHEICNSYPNGRIVNGNCYIFMKERKNYDEANKFCKTKGARLFEPRTKAINKLVFDKSVEAFGDVSHTWIGINDMINEGHFVFTSSGENVMTFIWSTFNNLYDDQDCVAFAISSGPRDSENWFDLPCSKNYRFICEFI